MSRRLRNSTPGLAVIATVLLTTPAIGQTSGPVLRDISGHTVDEGQLRNALASRTLTWLTGTAVDNDYVSVGRMANFFGFVALRVSSAHSLTRAHVARDTIAVLEPRQVAALATLVDEQRSPHTSALTSRIGMNRALERLLVGEEVTHGEFLELGRTYGAAEAELGQVIADRFGEVAATLTPEQRSRLVRIRSAHVSGQADTNPRTGRGVKMPDVDRKELVNLAARFLSWTTGSPELNDFEVVGKPSQHFGFVSLRLQSGHSVRRGAVAGEVLDLLTPDQHQMLETAVRQNVAVFSEFLSVRSALMRELEAALQGHAIDQRQVRELGAAIGEAEARMTWAQAQAMLDVRSSLSSTQRGRLMTLRAKYTLSGTDRTTGGTADLGRQLFAQCALCHVAASEQAVAPSLAGILGRDVAGDPNYGLYSPALRRFAQRERTWSPSVLDDFLRSPRELVPGTTMGFDGLSSARDRAVILSYLATME